jgi:hypothetical protein
MPVEGQAQRAGTPFSRREKRVLGTLAAVAVVAVVAIGIVSVTNSDPPPAAGCIRADIPSTMGGTRITACGAKARALCRTQPGGVENAIVAECRRVGYATESP